jgi:hypothetical protein
VVKRQPEAHHPGSIIAHRLPERDKGASQRPAVVVVREPDRHPEPAVVVVKQPSQRRVPAVVAVKPHSGAEKHKKVKTHRAHKKEVAAAPPARIKVVFRKGSFTVKKRSYPLEPQEFDLSNGESRDIVMGGRKGKLTVRVSYINGELLIDDAPGKNHRSTRLGFAPGWKDGQGYAIEASDHGLLKDLDILILSQ